jgi:hypothetical protein
VRSIDDRKDSFCVTQKRLVSRLDIGVLPGHGKKKLLKGFSYIELQGLLSAYQD